METLGVFRLRIFPVDRAADLTLKIGRVPGRGESHLDVAMRVRLQVS